MGKKARCTTPWNSTSCVPRSDWAFICRAARATHLLRAVRQTEPNIQLFVFGIAREPVPQCVIPEVEIFLGDVPITKYAIPGGQEFASTILPFVKQTNVIILANHGTVSYGETVERAYWWTEILDAYCRMLLLAKQLGKVNFFTEDKERELLELKQKWGWSDPRNTEEYKNCDICANDIFRESWKNAGVERKAFPAPPPMGPSAAKSGGGSNGSMDQETLVQMITQRVMDELAKR